ncbi:MAG: DNA (cytosine-5-)-methyltransferase [Sphingomicrobium sp.]
MILTNSFSALRQKTGLSIEELAKETGFSTRTLYRWESGEMEPRAAVVRALETLSAFPSKRVNSDPKFRFIDLFAGIGGLRRGFEPLGGECVFTSEWDRYSQKTYLANFECDHQFAGDITKVPLADIPEHDVLLAGFPCQPFSIAGVSKKNALGRAHGFACEAQGTLFFDVARIIKHHQPRAFLLENVKNLVNHDRGRTFEVIQRILKVELGYEVHKRVINAKSFVPQNRERIFIVGFREKTDFDFNNLVVPDPLAGPKLATILHPEDGSEPADRQFLSNDGSVLEKYTLTEHLWKYLQGYALKHQQAGNGFGFGLVGPNDVSRTLSARYYKDGSEILVQQPGKAPRRLTPRECARLMGFEEPGNAGFVIPVSDTQAYRQFGNAVVVPVAKAVAGHMAPYIVAREAEAESTRRSLALVE